MPSKKRNLEKVEQIINASSMTEPPQLMSDEDLLYWYRLLEEALSARVNAPIKTAPACRDEDNSEGRRALESYIATIAKRIKGAPRPPVPPLVLNQERAGQCAAEAPTQTATDNGETAEALLARLMRKAEKR